MKNIFSIAILLFISVSIFSCKNDDYETIESSEKIKIDSVKMLSDTISLFSVLNIKTYSTYPSSCNGFYGYDYVHSANFEREVTSYQYKTNGDCSSNQYVAGNIIKFNPQQTGTYHLKFWKGDNNWITKTIVVQ